MNATAVTDPRIDACNKILAHIADCRELAIVCGLSSDSRTLDAALDSISEVIHVARREIDLDSDPHAGPGEFCPTCGDQHCSREEGHEWSDDDYCVHCGADGRS